MIFHGQSRWADIAENLKVRPPGALVRVEKHRVQHPRDGGLHLSAGLPVGQQADYRMSYPGCGGLHVRDFGAYYVAHLDRVNPACDPLGHVLEDVPHFAGGVAVGALIGLLFGRSKEALVAGAVIGAAIGLTASVEAAKVRGA
jgi:hypothetical protein